MALALACSESIASLFIGKGGPAHDWGICTIGRFDLEDCNSVGIRGAIGTNGMPQRTFGRTVVSAPPNGRLQKYWTIRSHVNLDEHSLLIPTHSDLRYIPLWSISPAVCWTIATVYTTWHSYGWDFSWCRYSWFAWSGSQSFRSADQVHRQCKEKH